MELLAPDRGQQVGEILGGDRPSPAVAGPVEQLIGLTEVLELAGVVLRGPDLGEPVLGPCLPAEIPDRLERRQGLGEQAPPGPPMSSITSAMLRPASTLLMNTNACRPV